MTMTLFENEDFLKAVERISDSATARYIEKGKDGY
jgi:hypothetical protein